MQDERVPRGDVRRNRAEILRAALASLVGRSAAVPALHSEVVRRSGLGRATVYRHFGDRRQLADAALVRLLQWMRDGLERDSREHSYRELLSTVFEVQAWMRPVASLVRELPAERQGRILDELVETLTPGFEEAQARGEIRADLSPRDLATLLVMLDAAATGPNGRQDPQRFIDLVIDGLFTPAPTTRHTRERLSDKVIRPLVQRGWGQPVRR